MSVDREQGDPGDEPRFRSPFSDVDRDVLEARAPHLVEFLDLAAGVREVSKGHRSLGGQEALAALRALEVARRLVETMSTDMLAHYQRIGDCSAHGYRTTAGLLAGEFRVTPGEARRRTTLSERLAGRVSEIGEAQEPVRPAVAEQFADGRISADEAKALCDAVDDLPPTIRAAHADRVEKTLVELAPTVSLKDVPKLSQRIIQNIDPDGTLPRFETDPRKYHVTLTQQRNGDWRMKGLLDCPTGTTLRALLYGRMKDADVPVAVRPHAACNAEGDQPAGGRLPGPDDLPDPDDLPATGDLPVPDDADDYSVTSAVDTERAAVPGEADDRRAHTNPAASGSRVPPIPQIPLEAMWEVTRVTVRADATIDVDGRLLSFLEDEPHICLDETGWPVHLRPRVTEEVQRLLREARASDSGAASGEVREKILGRTPTNPKAADGMGHPPEVDRAGQPPPPGQHPPGDRPSPLDRPPPSDRLTPLDPPPPSDQPPPLDRPLLAPVVTDGVFDDGSRSGLRITGTQGGLPGLARHDRFAFLLRSVARERVLHGADHALVVTASADELVRPRALLSTHAGTPTTLGALEEWSNAAQMFVHVTDGGGRSLDVRSQGRFATRTQMAVLAARDQGCTFPDCDAPAEWCEAHHILAYARGGETKIDNLTLVCPFHHRWFERTGWDSEFHRGLPAWRPPKAIDPRRRLVFHSRFRVALLGSPPELPFDE